MKTVRMSDTERTPATTMPVTVRELDGSEGGMWCVVTFGSCHYFNLDLKTVVRVPGPEAVPLLGDLVRPLRKIEICRVGSRGSWTLNADPWDQENDYFLHSSSVIQEIKQVVTARSVGDLNTGLWQVNAADEQLTTSPHTLLPDDRRSPGQPGLRTPEQ